MKIKGQIESQVFIYILAFVIMGALLLFGYIAISGFSNKTNEAGQIELESSIKNAVEAIAPKFGSVEIKTFGVPADFTEICFTGTVKKEELPFLLVEKHPLIADSVISGNNVFFVGKNMDFFKTKTLSLPNKAICIPVVDGNVQIGMEGRGDAAYIFNVEESLVVNVPQGVMAKSAEIHSSDYSAVMKIPSGARVDYPLGSEGQITLEQVTSFPPMSAVNAVSEVFDFGPDGTVFDRKIPLTLSYDQNKVTDVNKLKIYFFDGSNWVPLDGDFDVDSVAHTITGYTNHFTLFTVAEPLELIVRHREMVFGSLDNAYSPEIITFKGKKAMWIGGWLTNEERGGLDKIYYSEFQNGVWNSPVPSFEKEGYLVNDPSIIQPPSSDGIDRTNWLYMYYTGLNFPYTDPLGENVVGFASSIDGGKTWTDHDIIIGHSNANECGAWSPSAIINNNEIWLYYHVNRNHFPSKVAQDGSPLECEQGVYLTKLNLNGWRQIETIKTQASPEIVNVDVVKNGEKFVMVGNSNYGDKIYRYDSEDGVMWKKYMGPLIDAKGSEKINDGDAVITPHMEFTGPKTFNLYFGFGTKDFTSFNSIHMWEFEEG